ncbi:E3 ubiquitin-protein ligase ZNRF2-like isoform X2 [Sinocyclocheilus anshuiensis]|uniref:E3 ubiquitin-protein ligase ZNRF2-like isoform X2 n=1 Tax=Sinocyclocheilus anshuiensis TaxID=1608454 RepID=UPI0007B9D166|nr:PREDICTED: E3 ubiquitin-protein ligase ZNRF2-like isoform X2 [Sinocyclocheilus anshuiensis]
MGAKQSSPAADGRTRAYSGSDLPSSNGGGGGRTAAVAMRYHAHGASGATSSSSSAAAAAHFTGSRRPQSSITIPNSVAYSSQESGYSTPEENGGERERSAGAPRLLIGSLPAHLSPHLFGGFKCPVCSKFISSDEMDLHLVMCLTKPRVTYNEVQTPDVLLSLWDPSQHTASAADLGQTHTRTHAHSPKCRALGSKHKGADDEQTAVVSSRQLSTVWMEALMFLIILCDSVSMLIHL